MKLRRIVLPFFALLAIAVPLLLAGGSKASISLLTQATMFTPDQINAGLNSVINSINQQSMTCTTTGCVAGGPSAAPVLSGNCVTAGGATSALSGNANNWAGRVTCTSTANTVATLTWAVAHLVQPVCQVVGETTAVTTYTTNSTTVLTWNYASTASPIFDYICTGA
jgi:hypothetical protein